MRTPYPLNPLYPREVPPYPSALDGIGALLDSSLVRRRAQPDGESRFAMLGTIREFGLEQLEANGETDLIRRRHASWCIDLAEAAWAALTTRPKRPDVLDPLEAVHNDFRSALAFLERAGAGAEFVRLAGALAPFWILRSHRTEGEQWLRRALASGPDAPTNDRARALTGLGLLLLQSEAADVTAIFEHGLELGRQSGDEWSMALSLHGMASRALGDGDYARAMSLWEDALPLMQQLPDSSSRVALVRYHLGLVELGRNNLDGAASLLSEAATVYRDNDDAWGMASSLTALGLVECDRGRLQESAASLTEAIAHWELLGMREGLAAWIAAVAALAAKSDRPERAVELYGAESAIRATVGAAQALPERARHERALAMLRRKLGDDAFDSAWTSAQAWSLEDALEHAQSALSQPLVNAGGRADPGPAGLTAREIDVLRLLAAGRTNQEIADELFISLPTVKVHVSHLYAKIGADSRVAAAAYAHRYEIA